MADDVMTVRKKMYKFNSTLVECRSGGIGKRSLKKIVQKR